MFETPEFPSFLRPPNAAGLLALLVKLLAPADVRRLALLAGFTMVQVHARFLDSPVCCLTILNPVFIGPPSRYPL